MPLRKKPPPAVVAAVTARRVTEPQVPKLNAPSYFPNPRKPHVDPQTGERVYSFDSETSTLVGDSKPYDVTEMIHSLTRELSDEDLHQAYMNDHTRPAGERDVEKLPASLWELVAGLVSEADAASLALASKTLRAKLARLHVWDRLDEPELVQQRLEFLHRLDKQMPLHILCTPCATYHTRIWMGNEQLKQNLVANPLFLCPRVKTSRLARTRITYARELPFTFVQLATRHANFGALHGVAAATLARRWKQLAQGTYTSTGAGSPQWEHASRYVVVKGHFYMRVTSSCVAPPSMLETERRLLLFERQDFTPYFSVCAHWQSGELVKLCKCILSHIPEPPERLRDQFKHGYAVSLEARNRGFVPKQCPFCKDVRRCPECPTEYLAQIKMVEARTSGGRPTFKHALVVTRWSDLGDGSSPALSPEWAAVTGNADNTDLGSFNSVEEAGRRSISAIFEAETNNHLFLRRVVNLNPKKDNPGFQVENPWE